MAAFTTGADWGFPDDVPGTWLQDENEREGASHSQQTPPRDQQESDRAHKDQGTSSAKQQNQGRRRRTHYPPRQCRICLEVVEPTFHTPETSALPASLQPEPRVTYESSEDGGRLLRPCRCRGTQKYVHEQCLSAWRMQDPLRKRNYWQCPTCHYCYRLQRLTWAAWVSSTPAQLLLTLAIFLVAMFALGFVADPIINLYLDPVHTIASAGGPTESFFFDDEPPGWTEHFVKGLASLGLLGFVKFLLTLSPWHWLNMRNSSVYVPGGRGGVHGGRGRINQLSWVTIVVGIVMFLYAVWQGVRAWSRRTLSKAGEKVMDVPGAHDDDEDD